MSKTVGLDSAGALLKRAVELDQEQNYAASLVCYQEGVGLLIQVLKDCSDSTMREQIRAKLTQYMDRAEKVKDFVDRQKEEGKYHEEIHIEDNSTGHSYEKMFSRFIDGTVTQVEIQDPYLRSTHQIFNLLRFCELLVKQAPHLKTINVTTSTDKDQNPSQQQSRFRELETSLRKYRITITFQYSSSLHDREIRFDCGWIFKLGRGLDYFKRVDGGQFAIGFCDFDLRPCHETKIDIFHKKHTKSSFSGS